MSRFASPYYETSQPYPVVFMDAMATSASIVFQPQFQWDEILDTTSNLAAGTLVSSLVTYSLWPAEIIDTTSNLTAGTLYLGLVVYPPSGQTVVPEAIDTTANITAGTLVLGLITYSNWPAEIINTTSNLVGGTLQ